MKIILAVAMIAGAFIGIPNLAVSDQVTHTIRCESEEFSPRHCRLPVTPRNSEIKEIRKSRQLSSKPCIEGKSWEADESGITVSNGCRAEFMVVYRIYDHSDRRERRHQRSESDYRQEQSDDRHPNYSQQDEEDPTEIVVRLFEDVLNRKPSREEVRFYRNLIVERGWSERQIRRELRDRNR
jgi:hypothetical protein